MISTCRFDFVDRIHLIPVVGSISSLTCLFMKVIGTSFDILKKHSLKELLIVSIPFIGTAYLIFMRCLPATKKQELKKQEYKQQERKPATFPHPLPASPPLSSRRNSLDSQRSLSSEDLESLEQLQTTIANK